MKLTTLCIRVSSGKILTRPLDSIFIPKLFADEFDFIPYDDEQGVERGQLNPSNPPQLIIFKHGSTFDAWKFYQQIKHSWGDKPFILMLNEEAYDLFNGMVDYSLSYRQDTIDNTYFLASWLVHTGYVAMHTALMDWHMSEHKSSNKFSPVYADPNEFARLRTMIDEGQATPKSRFCNFIYGRRNLRYPGVRQRNRLCKKLNKYKKVDCAGRVMHNTDDLRELEKHNPTNLAKLKFIAQYKFTIAAENRHSPGYITEKLIYPLLVGSIPIYCGTNDITKLLNPRAFINCNDYDSLDQLVQKVAEIDTNPELHQEYVTAPLFLDDSLAYDLSADRLKTKLQAMLNAIKKHNIEHPNNKPKEEATIPLHKRLSSYLEYRAKKNKAVKEANSPSR